MKLLLYCTKAKPSLKKYDIIGGHYTDDAVLGKRVLLNGKIVAECDFEVEEIKWNTTNWVDNFLTTKSMSEEELQKRSCVNGRDLREYFEICYDSISDSVVGYAIHIKNLYIFDKPRDIRDYYTNRIYTKIEDVYTDEIQIKGSEWVRPIKQAPQNMMYAYDGEENEVLISIRPEWLYKILNGEKTIEVRKKVLKEMIQNE